jgi:hypothetical protein
MNQFVSPHNPSLEATRFARIHELLLAWWSF